MATPTCTWASSGTTSGGAWAPPIRTRPSSTASRTAWPRRFAGDYVTAIVGGSSMQHKIIEGEVRCRTWSTGCASCSTSSPGVWADNDYGSSTTLRIQSKAPSWTYPDVYVDTGIAVLPGVVNEPFAITAGVNDALLFTFDGDGGPQVSVTLSAGAARTGAEVAGEIEAAFEAAGAPGDRAGR